MATSLPSQVHQNYHQDCEAAINNQIRLELYASQVYLSMASYFDHMASKHLVKFLLQQSSKEKEHAERLIQLQNERGGVTHLHDITKPDRNSWGNSLKVLECALNLSMTVNQSLMELHKLATEKMDVHLCNFLGSHYLQGQKKFIKELGDHVTKLRKMGAQESGLAEYLFDKLTLGDSQKK